MDNTGLTVCVLCGQDLPVNNGVFAGRLRKARVTMGLTEKELGLALDYKNGAQVTRWESEARPMPDSLALLNLMADVLGVRVEWLLTGDEPATNNSQEARPPGIPVDRAGRPMEDADGNPIPVSERVEGEVRSKG